MVRNITDLDILDDPPSSYPEFDINGFGNFDCELLPLPSKRRTFDPQNQPIELRIIQENFV
jgi:hypothetical protein